MPSMSPPPSAADPAVQVFLVSSAEGLPPGVRAGPRLYGSGTLSLGPRLTSLTGISRPVPLFIGILAVGGLVACGLLSALVQATGGEDLAYTMRCTCIGGPVLGCLTAMAGVILWKRLKKEVRLVADPRRSEARFSRSTGVLVLEFADGRWAALLPAAMSSGRQPQLLAQLKACYGNRLTIND